MDFKLTKGQRDVKRAVREFAENKFKPELAREYDRKRSFHGIHTEGCMHVYKYGGKTHEMPFARAMFGGYSYFADYDIEQSARDVRVTQIYEGTNQMQENGILENISQVLGIYSY